MRGSRVLYKLRTPWSRNSQRLGAVVSLVGLLDAPLALLPTTGNSCPTGSDLASVFRSSGRLSWQPACPTFAPICMPFSYKPEHPICLLAHAPNLLASLCTHSLVGANASEPQCYPGIELRFQPLLFTHFRWLAYSRAPNPCHRAGPPLTTKWA
ncbi:Uncharacterized protein TCM_021052 [Theobroma cacao]|uniref:Uncharacterized protein n=1 Tax=Theobroma cacao TaxID=3641 RepID=A0A061EML8_THECC|nr:Uncharacterized protein TCM_021052 [Theobroma cacao]